MTDLVTRVEKPWGHEDILERNQAFVVKRIVLNSGEQSSLQVHERKQEWVEVLDGIIELTIGTDQERLERRRLGAGEIYRVPPGTIHRVLAVETATILEVCTPGDDDIIRLKDNYGRTGQHETRATAWRRVRALWTSPLDHLAALVLVVGLVVAGVLVAMAHAVSLPALNVIQGDAPQLHDVAKYYISDWVSPAYDPLVHGRLRVITPLLTLAYFVSVTSLGSLVIARIRGVESWPRPVRLLAGFLPGYLMVIAPLQLLYAFVPFVTASWIALVAVMGAALAVHRATLLATGAQLRSDSAYRARWGRGAAWAVGLVALALLFRLQAGRNFMVADSIGSFLQAAKEQLAGTHGRYLLQWDQQSDEWLFNAPLMFTSHGSRDYLFPLYAAEAMGLASFGALVFGVVRSFATRRAVLAAALVTGAVLLATPAIHPIFYVALVGGQNPTVWIGLVGRYVGIVAPWVALLLVGRVSGRSGWVAVGFATLGLGFASLHVAVFVVVALVMALLWPRLRGRRPALLTGARGQVVFHVLAGVALAAPVLTYGLLRRVSFRDELTYVLLAGAIVAVVTALALAAGSRVPAEDAAATPRPAGRRALKPILGWTGLLILGFVLSNNLTNGFASGGIRDVLGTVLPGYDANLASRGLLGDTPLSGLSFGHFTGGECYITGHCLSPGGFVGSYGFIIILSAAAWLGLGRLTDDEHVNRYRAAWLTLVGALSFSFLLVDFSGAEVTVAWIITRFLEVPYYGLLGLATIVLVGSRDRLTAIAGGTVIALWTLVPVLYNLVPLQLVKNADWLVGLVSK